MNDQSQLLLRSIKGPVIMITVGVLFAADRYTNYQFHQTWPVLLIVIGLMQLLGGRRRRADYYPPPAPGVQQPSAPFFSPIATPLTTKPTNAPAPDGVERPEGEEPQS